MIRNFKAPNIIKLEESINKTIFLGGSIEMDKAEKWQDALTETILHTFENVAIFNPRRDNWDASLENSLNNPVFEEQVSWEVEQLEKADVIFLYFQPGTMSPISLLELGLFASSGKVVVCCPEGFWRKGNVDFICRKFNIPTINNYMDILDYLG